jgi:hypothetical protein
MNLHCPICGAYPRHVLNRAPKEDGKSETASGTATAARVMPCVRPRFDPRLPTRVEGRWSGSPDEGPLQSLGSGKVLAQNEGGRRATPSQDPQESLRKIGLMPARQGQRASNKGQAKRGRLRIVHAIAGKKPTGYRYGRQRAVNNIAIAEGLMRLANRQTHWGMSNCYLYLRHVQGFRWSYSRVYRIYQALALHLRRI